MRGQRGAGHSASCHDIGLSEACLASKRPCSFWPTRRLDFVQSRQCGRLKGTPPLSQGDSASCGQRPEVVLRDDAESDGTLEMVLDCVCGVAKVSASVHYHHWREQPEDTPRDYLEFVIDASGIAGGGEAEAVAPLDRLEVRHDPQLGIPLELLKLLDDRAEATQGPLEPCAVADRLIVQPA
jgi:hypothetical protein